MKLNLKKVLSIIVVVSLFLSFTLITSAEEGNENFNLRQSEIMALMGFSNDDITAFNEYSLNGFSNQDILRFVNLGFSKKQILDFNEIDLEYLNNMKGELIGIDDKYMQQTKLGMVEISKEQYDKEVKQYLELKSDKLMSNTDSSISSICDTYSSTCEDEETTGNWMKLSTRISRISQTSPQEYIIVHEFNWTKKPFYKYKDAVGVAHHVSMSPIQNSEYLKYTTDRYAGPTNFGPWTYQGVEDYYYWTANDKTGGMGFEFGVRYDSCGRPIDPCYKHEDHRGTVAYRVIRNNSTYTYGDLSGHYIHTESSFSGALGVDAKGTGSFTISANVTKDEAIQTGITFKY